MAIVGEAVGERGAVVEHELVVVRSLLGAVPTEDGRANEAPASVVVDVFGPNASDVKIVSGEKSRTKRFRLSIDDVDAFSHRLDELVAAGTSGPGPTDRDKRRPAKG